MFGRLLSYSILGNKIELQFEKKPAFISVIRRDIVNFFVPLLREEKNSKAIENLEIEEVEYYCGSYPGRNRNRYKRIISESI